MVVANRTFLKGTSEYQYKEPKVILDIWYGNSEEGTKELEEAISDLNLSGVNVYAAYPSPDHGVPTLYEDHDSKVYSRLYDSAFAGGRLHVNYLKYKDPCLRSYKSFIEISKDTINGFVDKEIIESLIYRVANDGTINKTNKKKS